MICTLILLKEKEADVSGLFGSAPDEGAVFETFGITAAPTINAPAATRTVDAPHFLRGKLELEPEGNDKIITRALVIGDFETAVRCCVELDRMVSFCFGSS